MEIKGSSRKVGCIFGQWSFYISLLLFAWIGTAESAWLPQSLWALWSTPDNYDLRNPLEKTSLELPHSNYNQYQYDGSVYRCPHHHEKTTTFYPRSSTYTLPAALYDYYPMAERPRPFAAKPTPPSASIPQYYHQLERPAAWSDYRLLTNSALLHNDPKHPQQYQHQPLPKGVLHGSSGGFAQWKRQQPVVVAHNGIFILNNNAGSSDIVRVSGSKGPESGPQSSHRLKVYASAP